MSYENTVCPCGGKKLTDTMLCTHCEAALKDRPEAADYKDTTNPIEWRRHAAIIMLALARRRGTANAHKSTCQHCEFFDGDTDLTWIHIGTRSHQVYLHRCRVNPDRTDPDAVHPCFISRAEQRRLRLGYDKPVAPTAGAVQPALI